MSTPDTQAPPVDDERVEEFVDSVLIERPRHVLFAFWRDFKNLPKFMQKVRAVTEVDAISSIWTVAMGPQESSDWEFIVTDEEQDRMIAWSASGHTPVKYSGRVEFRDVPAPPPADTARDPAPAPCTEVTATLRYRPETGLLDSLIAKVAGEEPTADLPVQTRGDLLRFKEVIERGDAA